MRLLRGSSKLAHAVIALGLLTTACPPTDDYYVEVPAGGSGGGAGRGGAGRAGGGGGQPCPDCTGCVEAMSEKGHSYLLCFDAVTNSQAEERCADEDMVLARINDAMENMWLRSTMDMRYKGSYLHAFVGASDAEEEGEWSWNDGRAFWHGNATGQPEPLAFHAWDAFQPNNTSQLTASEEDCMVLGLANGLWSDMRCDIVFPFICEDVE